MGNLRKDLSHELKNKEAFFKAVLLLESIEECADFFEDICTINELKLISQRLHVAKLLNEGATFNEIVKLTGASTTTISRVNRSLQYGSGAYDRVLERLEQSENEKEN